MTGQKTDVRGLTVSEGTLEIQDLIPAFRSVLDLLEPGRAEEIEEEILLAGWLAGWGGYGGAEEEREWMLAELTEALEQHAPDGYTFGSHPGDGALFGFWPCEDETEAEACLDC